MGNYMSNQIPKPTMPTQPKPPTPPTPPTPPDPPEKPVLFNGSDIPKIYIEDCVMCGVCQHACPVNAITTDFVISDNCINCAACIDECPTEAIR